MARATAAATVVTAAATALLIATTPAPSFASASTPALEPQQFNFWSDPPGSPAYQKRQPHWYDPIETVAGQSFPTSDGGTVAVNWTSRGAIHLFADPGFQQGYDNLIRQRNGPASQNWTGTIDSCGWPAETPATAKPALQWQRSTVPLYDDFSKGFRSENFLLALGTKQCCDGKDFTKNVHMTTDVVNGTSKNVLALTAYNMDVGCPGPSCRKIASSVGAFETTALYGSGSYEVVAKVADAPGLIWAIWTFHYEEHLPSDCANFSCYCAVPPTGRQDCPKGECMPASYLHEDACPTHGPNWDLPCANTTLCDQWWDTGPVGVCGKKHEAVGADPQFFGDSSFAGYRTLVNHEIDIEIPASCLHTNNVCPHGTCAGDYSTANFNNYIATNNGGLGNGLANMCVKAAGPGGVKHNFLGDGKYHSYRFDWHTGDDDAGIEPHVDFFIDDVYLGTNNAMVPTRGSRFFVSHWGGSWNGNANNWGGGAAGDGKSYSVTSLVSSVKVTPFNEANDIMYASFGDAPDGCDINYRANQCHKWKAVDLPPASPTKDDDTPPPPPPPPPASDDDSTKDCTQASGRPDGCPCGHSYQCASDWCTGVCGKKSAPEP